MEMRLLDHVSWSDSLARSGFGVTVGISAVNSPSQLSKAHPVLSCPVLSWFVARQFLSPYDSLLN
jgi:hypothetical protein